MTLYQELRLDLGQLFGMGYADCAWADCWLLAGPIAPWQSAMSVPISAQLQSNRIIFLLMGGWPDCAWADCWHSVRPIAWGQSAVRLPSSAQHQPNRDQPCLERLLSLG